MFGTALESVMGVLLIALGIIAALVLLAYTGEVGLILISRLVHVFIAPFEWILHVVLHALDRLGGQIETVLQDFRDRQGDDKGAWAGWTIIASLCSLMLFLGLGTCDFYNTLVKLGPIIGILVPYNPTLFSLSLGLSFLLAFLVIGWGIADVFGLSPLNMHKKLSDNEKHVLRRVMLGTMFLALVTTVFLMILATEVRAGIDDTILFGIFLCLYATLMLIATFIAGVSLFSAIASFYILLLGTVRFITWIAGCLFYLPYSLLIMLHDLLVHVLIFLETVGRFIWNRVAAKHPIEEKVRPEPPTIKVLELPHIGIASASQTDGQEKKVVKELLLPDSVPPKDAA